MIASGCEGYLASFLDVSWKDELQLGDVLVDVFSEDLPGLPLERNISFEIELFPSQYLFRRRCTELHHLN